MKILKEVLLIVTSLFTLNSFSQEIDNDLDSTIYLNEIIVNAFQISTLQLHVPGSVSVLTGEEIQITDGNNFAHTLHSIPGIYMHSGTYSTSRVIIRGVGSRTPYNTNRIKSYLNDIPITSSDGISTPEDIDLMGIGRMEVIKGPASATYGSGLGGNIILYTPRSTKEGAAALIQYGSFNTIKAAASGNYINQNLNLWGTISHVNSDGYRENNRYRRTSFISSGEWEQKDYSLEYTLMLIDLNAQIPSSVGKSLYESNPKAAAANWSAIEGYKKYQRAIAGVTLTNLFSDKWTNKLNVFGRWADSYERRPFNNLDDGTSGGGISNRLSYHNNQWDAMIGFEWVKDVYRWKMDLENEMINKNRESRDHYNLFSMIYWRPASEWNISLGGAVNKVNYLLRDQFLSNGDQSGERSFPLIFSPRLGINYAPSQLLAFYGSVGHGFSMPSPEETLLPEGDINKELKPEQGVQYEMGFRLNLFRRATTIEASVYYINLNNLLVTKRLSEDIFTGINAGKTSHNGFEFLIKQKILRLSSFPGTLNLNANYTWSINKFVDFTDNDQKFDGNKLPGIPAQIAHANILWQPFTRLNIDTQLQYVGEQYMDDANSLINEGYFIANIRSSYSFSVSTNYNVELFTGINNITNAHYSPMLTVNAVAFGNAEPRYYYPGLPRHFYSGIKLFL
jgi:iron complex outermembrane receptor protein